MATAKEINPDYVPHKKLEDEFIDYISSRGYTIVPCGIETDNEKFRNGLMGEFTESNFRHRTKPDYLVSNGKKIFYVEIKTHYSKKYNDCCLELLPLYWNATNPIPTMYIYQDRYFWAHEAPVIRQAQTETPHNKEHAKCLSEALNYFDIANHKEMKKNQGSGDSFVIIDEKVWKSLPYWKIISD